MSELPSRDGYVRSMRNLKAFYPSDHDAIKAYIDQLEAYVERSTHPQPVTPAGGEVGTIGELGGKVIVLYDEEIIGRLPKGTKLYTHPPVADAALLEQALRKAWNCGLSEKYMDFAAEVAALNQRGGG